MESKSSATSLASIAARPSSALRGATLPDRSSAISSASRPTPGWFTSIGDAFAPTPPSWFPRGSTCLFGSPLGKLPTWGVTVGKMVGETADQSPFVTSLTGIRPPASAVRIGGGGGTCSVVDERDAICFFGGSGGGNKPSVSLRVEAAPDEEILSRLACSRLRDETTWDIVLLGFRGVRW